jgi:tRNA G46 methylase TrmB
MNTFFSDPARYNLGDLVDQILIMQTDYSWPKEAECLENHGLKSAKRVLDIGTGNGHFLCRMAERYPDKQFVGIETSEPLIERASKIARGMNLAGPFDRSRHLRRRCFFARDAAERARQHQHLLARRYVRSPSFYKLTTCG